MTAIELMADAMQHVKFEPAEFARELKVVRRELADGEVDRQRVLWKLLHQTVYTTHPARHPIIGYLDVLNATTNQTIIDFYHERYVPNNQVFVVVGDVETQQVLDAVAKQYAGTPRGRETYVPFEDEPEQLSPREAVREMDGATYDMVFAWPTVKLSHPDLYALDVAAYILGEGESSRLVQRLKYEQQVVLSVGTVSDTPHYVAGHVRRDGRQPAGDVAEGRRRNPPRGLPPARRAGRPGGTGQGQEAEGGRAGLRPADGRSRRPTAWAATSSPPAIRCSTRPTSRAFRRSRPSRCARSPGDTSCRSGSTA